MCVTNNMEENSMDNNVNPIRLGIGQTNLLRPKQNEDVTEKPQKKAEHQEEKRQNPNDVLNFMAGLNSDLVPAKVTRTVDVSKYVTPEQEARIAEFMKGFEADIETISTNAQAEFPELSENAANAIALAYVDSTY